MKSREEHFAEYYTINSFYFTKPVSLIFCMFKLICYETCYDSQGYILTNSLDIFYL